MKLKVLKRFHDKVTGALYSVGSEIEVSDKRGAEILAAPGNLAVKVEGSKDDESEGNGPAGENPEDGLPEGEGSKDDESKNKNKNKNKNK